MQHTFLLATMVLGGCVVSEDNFPPQVADAMCDRINQCTNEFEDQDERDDCEAFWEAAAEIQVDLGELFGGEYSSSAGAACIREIRLSSCADFNSNEIDCDVFEE